MRTTVILPDALAAAAKRRAAEEGRTFTSLIEEALRAVLDQPSEVAPVELPVFHGGGTIVDLGDRDAVWEALDAGDDR